MAKRKRSPARKKPEGSGALSRRDLKETWAALKKQSGVGAPPIRKREPWLPDHHAGIDRKGEPTDIMFFRTVWEETDFSAMTMPRRYMNRSTFRQVSFVNTDLNQSFMCWNDFIECDFTDADLTCADMRASLFQGCKFVRCRLIGADLRRSGFEDCDFTDADLTGAVVDTDSDIEVSEPQSLQIDWRSDEGPEPKGG
jgi:hypothetical protein